MAHSIRTLVAGVATVSSDDPALAAAIEMAQRLGADLHLVHATDEDDAGAVRARLDAVVQQVAGARPSIRIAAIPGDPDEVLPRAAEELGADLLVVGATRRGPVQAAMLGTTAQTVLRAARVPVLLLRAPIYHQPTHRVLAATDLSGHSAHALQLGLPIARAIVGGHGTPTRAVHVTGPDYAAELVQGEFASAQQAIPKLEAFLRDSLPGETLEAKTRVGNAGREIVDEAGEWEADIVVMGTHGRSGVRRLFVGSVAENVVRNAPCAVLVVPPTAVSAD
jgi:universal stress protein E